MLFGSGLCGFFDGKPDNDLMLRNKTTFAGTGSGRGQQPIAFNDNWRSGSKIYFEISTLLVINHSELQMSKLEYIYIYIYIKVRLQTNLRSNTTHSLIP
jgi:hypothetical protein